MRLLGHLETLHHLPQNKSEALSQRQTKWTALKCQTVLNFSCSFQLLQHKKYRYLWFFRYLYSNASAVKCLILRFDIIPCLINIDNPLYHISSSGIGASVMTETPRILDPNSLEIKLWLSPIIPIQHNSPLMHGKMQHSGYASTHQYYNNNPVGKILRGSPVQI